MRRDDAAIAIRRRNRAMRNRPIARRTGEQCNTHQKRPTNQLIVHEILTFLSPRYAS
jgi:hypothetical protein